MYLGFDSVPPFAPEETSGTTERCKFCGLETLLVDVVSQMSPCGRRRSHVEHSRTQSVSRAPQDDPAKEKRVRT